MAQIAAKKCAYSCNGVAVLYCRDCNQVVCVSCRQNVHDKVPLCKDHEFVNINNEGNRILRPHPVCDTHKKPFLYYCSRCDCLTCADCMSSNHNEHKTETIKKVADACRDSVNQIIEQLKTKIITVEKKLATIENIHGRQIKTDCELYVKKVDDTVADLQCIIDRHKLISITTASDFRCNENQNLDGRKTFFNQHHKETEDRLLKFKNLVLETHDSTFLTEWKTLQTDVQTINKETNDPLEDPDCIDIFNQDLFIRSVIEEIDQQFQMRLKEQEKAVSSLTKEMAVLTDDLKGKQEQIDELSKFSGQLKEKEKEVTELSDENENLKTEIKQRKQNEFSKLKEQEQTVTSLKNERDELEGELKERQEQINELSKLSGQFTERKKKLSNENEDLKKEIKEKEQKEVFKLEEQAKTVTRLIDEINVLKNILKGKQEQIDNLSKLSRNLDEKEKKVSELLDENDKLKTEVQQREQHELTKFKENEMILKELQGENAKLKTEIKVKQDQIEQNIKENTIRKPYKPYVSEEINKSNQVILKWNYDGELGEEEFYQIVIKQHPDGKWKYFQTPKPCITRLSIVDGLKAETSYVFKVRKANATLGEDGPFSPESDIIVTGQSTAFQIMKRSEKIEDGIPSVYRLPIQEIRQARNEKSQTRKFILGTPSESTKEKTIMIVGATGSGKSTMINGMANYVIGVTWEDSFRFTLIHLETGKKERVGNENLSQTEWMTCYTICSDVASRIDYTINFIDTPGLGDTGGLKQEAIIVSQIRDLFTAKDARGVATLDAVCFILKAPDARLTISQKYIYESILALFGNDIKNNICTLVTFADDQKPLVLAALEALDGKPFHFENYFPFNNSALFVDNRADHQGTLSPFFWKMGMKSCWNFFQRLHDFQTKSLLLTSMVLIKRQKLENKILHLQENIELGLSKINLLEQDVNVFTKYKTQIQDNENFEYEISESKKMEKVDISGTGIYTTTCLTCNFTCHNNCSYANDSQKANCCAMGSGGNCTECPDKCHWSQHSNLPYTIKWYTLRVKKTYSEMKDKYQKAHPKKMSQEEVLEKIHDEIKVLELGIQIKVEEITEYGNRLKEIALCPDPLNNVQYIERMIESEIRDKTLGFMQRVKTLLQNKKRAEIWKTFKIYEHRLRDTRASVNASTTADDMLSSDTDERV